MITVKIFKSIAVLFLLLSISSTAFAAEGMKTYQPERFNHAQYHDKMIVVDIYKDGCGTCAKQEPTLKTAREMYPDAAFFRVDFARDKEAVKRFRAIKQSTIIVFKGDQERARSMGETHKEKLLQMIAKGAS